MGMVLAGRQEKNMAVTGTVFDIKRYAVHDGPGIRTTVFFKGCPLQCWWCHNPEGIDPAPQRILESGIGKIQRKRILGEEMTVNRVLREIEKETIFYDESGGGVTFSGGEPLMQPRFLAALARGCRELGIHTALDTCGHAPTALFDEIRADVDVFLYDLKLIDSGLHRKYTGVDNELILENLNRLDEWGEEVIIRFPVIPGITDTPENLRQMGAHLKTLRNRPRIDLLPYHRMARGKYERLDMAYRMVSFESGAGAGSRGVSDRPGLVAVRSQLESLGFQVSMGG
jgi:pyruvate formate lyase activating enzyme